MILEAYSCSHIGKVRDNNEDNIYFNGLIKTEQAEFFSHYEKMNIKNGRAVFGVFDGMGGYSRGEYAAFVTADTAKKILKSDKKGSPRQLLSKICLQANKNVLQEADRQAIRMGSTLAMTYFENNLLHICNVGDSSIYRMRRGELVKLSCDHTEAAVYERIYGVKPPRDKKFPLTQHIGIPERSMTLDPFLHSDKICEDDVFLICSDGLTDMLEDAEISRLLNSSRPLSDIGEILINNANEKGGKDNSTIILIKATEVKERVEYVPEEEKSGTQGGKNNKRQRHYVNSGDGEYDKSFERQSILKIIVGTVLLFIFPILLVVCYTLTH